jgi:hypothetical protein
MKIDKCEAIIWRDAFHPYHGGWMTDEALEEFLEDTDYLCCNVGWIVHENKEMVTIAGMLSKQDSASHIQRIPTGCIVKRTRIKNPF